jgi:hypothetical protein
MNNKIFSDLLYSKQDKVEVSFSQNGLPIPFTKSVSDQGIADLEDRQYQEDLKASLDSSFVEGNPIVTDVIKQNGGRRNKNRRTRKNKKSKRSKKSRKH